MLANLMNYIDSLTTAVAMGFSNVVELNPFINFFISRFGVLALLGKIMLFSFISAWYFKNVKKYYNYGMGFAIMFFNALCVMNVSVIFLNLRGSI